MGPEVIVVDDVFEQLVGEVIQVVEGGAVDDVVVQGSPEALDLAIGLRPIGPGIAMFDAELDQHGLERVFVDVVARGELCTVVGKDFGELDSIGDVEGIDHLQRFEHDRERPFRS